MQEALQWISTGLMKKEPTGGLPSTQISMKDRTQSILKVLGNAIMEG